MEHNNGMPIMPMVVAEIELHYKSTVKPCNRFWIKEPVEAYQLLLQYWDHNRIELMEQFKLLLLNRSAQVLGIVDLSTGGTGSTIVEPLLIFASAIKANAHQIILAHNHPTGSLTPSKEDIKLTQKLVDGAKLLNLIIADHFIITTETYFSFSEKGLL